ncbi:hypothetical protein Ahy_A10g049884 isoform E [Arachis hypogaea]|uniref:ATP-dependent DNA helicase n=1 Tax=Arachis hypogaea TaxID=3818 RepID=A0A445B844_ARAHY|nr:hypothetical protein Ahy_A10g049884 isoform E [Arachis hypogaea]
MVGCYTSGIASLLLPNGRTAHSRFKIPLNIIENFVCNIKPGSPQAILLLKAKLIIWDEAPMVSRYCYEALDKCLGDIIRIFFKARTILAPTLDIVEEVNNHLMAIIPGGEKLYLSSYSICMDEGNVESQLDLYGSELLNSINCFGLPPHKLILKVGIPVMLLRNIDQSSGLCKGTRLQVRKLGNHVIEYEVLTGNNVGHIALIPRMNMVSTNETVPVRFQRRQFLIIVSFSMIINKSQGQTLFHVGLYLPKLVFTHGQLYVALSRVKSKRGLKVLLMNHVKMSANSTINIIYREVFEKIIF